MGIQRVPEVPFAQIANAALRDKRLSFKARGILAMVLSHSGEWQATAKWIEDQSVKDGPHAIQTALNELTALGYRSVSQEHAADGTIRTITTWSHEPHRTPNNPPTGKPALRETDPALEHYSTEHNKQNTQARLVRKPVDDSGAFDDFWAAYPRKEGKGHARRAWAAAIRKGPPEVIVAAAARYRDDPNREDAFTAHPTTWLNGERWTDDPLPGRTDSRVADLEDLIARAAARDAARGSG